jgi:hypothetical protein
MNFKLRVYSQEGSKNNNEGITKSIISRGTKKKMVSLCKVQMLKSEVIRIKDDVIVYSNY